MVAQGGEGGVIDAQDSHKSNNTTSKAKQLHILNVTIFILIRI